ncbi:IL21 protein, partial [Nothocercus nigrocapillus]|nr:IL21 protein [Nothocercus nigrocapillus]
MERIIIFCMLFFSSSMVLNASPQKLKYKQIMKTIDKLQTAVKNEDAELLHTPENPEDGCLFTAVTCFQNETWKLQPKISQENSEFIKQVKILRKPLLRSSDMPCESSCESYEKKGPKDFLKGFAKLMKQVIR